MQGMDVSQLQELVVSVQLHWLESQKVMQKRRVEHGRESRKVRKLEEEIKELQREKFVMFVPGRHPELPKRRYQVTLPGTYHLAFNQTLGYGGILPTLKIMECPVSRWTVTKSEHLLAANLFGQTRSWQSDMHFLLHDYLANTVELSVDDLLAGPPLLSYELHIAGGDGSNAYTLRSSKVFASQFLEAFQVNSIKVAHPTEESGDRTCHVDESRTTYPDLGIIPEHCDSAASRRLWEERFELLGAQHWAIKEAALRMFASTPLEGRCGPKCRVADVEGDPSYLPRALLIEEMLHTVRTISNAHLFVSIRPVRTDLRICVDRLCDSKNAEPHQSFRMRARVSETMVAKMCELSTSLSTLWQQTEAQIRLAAATCCSKTWRTT